jgi:hypothetical protein
MFGYGRSSPNNLTVIFPRGINVENSKNTTPHVVIIDEVFCKVLCQIFYLVLSHDNVIIISSERRPLLDIIMPLPKSATITGHPPPAYSALPRLLPGHPTYRIVRIVRM